MLKLECDRCKAISPDAIEIFGMPNGNPYANWSQVLPASFQIPKGWSKVLGKYLCDNCTKAIEYALNTREIGI